MDNWKRNRTHSLFWHSYHMDFSFQSDDDWKVKAEKKPRPISSGQQIDKYLNPPRHIVRTRAHVFFFVFFLGRGIYQINIFIYFILIIDYYFFYKKIQNSDGKRLLRLSVAFVRRYKAKRCSTFLETFYIIFLT